MKIEFEDLARERAAAYTGTAERHISRNLAAKVQNKNGSPPLQDLIPPARAMTRDHAFQMQMRDDA